MTRAAWDAADWDERFRIRILAAQQLCRRSPVLSHSAAAYVWNLPWLGDWPRLVDATDPTRPTTRSGSLVRWHAHDLEVADVVHRGGLVLTTPARTVADIALMAGFTQAVAVADAFLWREPSATRILSKMLDRRSLARRFPSANRAIAFAEFGAASAGESVSRTSAHAAGLPKPTLQKKFTDAAGRTAYADFWWEEDGVIGEFDGEKKYLRPEFRGGRSLERTLLDEKNRGDWLLARPEVRRLVRWGWDDANDPERLARRLTSVGLPRGAARVPGTPW